MSTERHEIEAWLGDQHPLTDEQVDTLVCKADEIAERYPDPDDRYEREAALAVAAWLMREDPSAVVQSLAHDRQRAARDETLALAGLRQAALDLIPSGRASETGFARDAFVDRMAVRTWLGKR